ncbi:MAG TPA: hypothetical protein VJC10_04255 [Patescibacteria group bacterium]|nr:hypothetical protein [Patescibacteria group bacterium]
MADPNILEEFQPPEGRVYLALGTRQKDGRSRKSFVGEPFEVYAFSYGVVEPLPCSSCDSYQCQSEKYLNGPLYKVVAASSDPSLFLEEIPYSTTLNDRLVDWALALRNHPEASGWRTFDQVVALISGHWNEDNSRLEP